MLKTKTTVGDYCTKGCAEADAWGPRYWDSHAIKIKDLISN